MTYPQQPTPPEGSAARSNPWFSSRDLGPAAVILVGMALAGVLIGLLWPAISPRTKGLVFLPNMVTPDESESMIAADGRFLLLTGAVGIIAAVAAWMRRSARGPATALALIAGGLLGALLTDFVGRQVGGGHDTGALNTVITLPVRVHARGLLFVEAAVAALVYAACALFARRDDLGVAENAVVLDGAPRLLGVRPGAGDETEWSPPRIEVTLDRAVVGSPDWIRAFAQIGGRYEPMALEPPAADGEGPVTYVFAAEDPPTERPVEVLVQLRRPYVDARSIDDGQWAFTVIAGGDALEAP